MLRQKLDDNMFVNGIEEIDIYMWWKVGGKGCVNRNTCLDIIYWGGGECEKDDEIISSELFCIH